MYRLIVILLALAGLMLPLPAHSDEVVVAVDQYPPWKKVADNTFEGIDIELVEALLAQVGMQPVYVECPWPRCLDMIKQGKADLLTGVLKRADRETYLTFIEPPYKTRSAKVFYRRADAPDIAGITDLENLKVGALRGASYFPEFDEAKSLKKEFVHEDRLNFLKLADGRLDVVVTTESQGDYLIAELDLLDEVSKCSYRHDTELPVYFAVSKESPLNRKIQLLNEAARTLRDNGRFETIIREHFDSLMQRD